MDFQFEGMTLANIAGGRVEELFQEALAELVEINGSLDQYQANADGEVKATVTLSLAFTMNAETDFRTAVASIATKRPARKAVGQAFQVVNGAVLIQPKLEQPDLFASKGDAAKVTPIGGARGAQGE